MDAALAPLLEPLLDDGRRGPHARRPHRGPRRVARASTARRPTGSSPTRRRCACRSSSTSPASSARALAKTAARHVDLLPTVLDAVALPVPQGLAGRSLVDAAAGQPEDEAATYFEALSGSAQPRLGAALRAHPGRLEIRRAPGARALRARERSGRGEEPRRVATRRRSRPLRASLAAIRAGDAAARPSRESEATLERLRSLGYLGAGDAAAKQRYTEADDPKTLVPLDAALQEVVALFTSGRREEALARCRALADERPSMPLTLVYLGAARARERQPRGGGERAQAGAGAQPAGHGRGHHARGGPDPERPRERGSGAARAVGLARGAGPRRARDARARRGAARPRRRGARRRSSARESSTRRARACWWRSAACTLTAGQRDESARGLRAGPRPEPRGGAGGERARDHGGGGGARGRGSRALRARERRRSGRGGEAPGRWPRSSPAAAARPRRAATSSSSSGRPRPRSSPASSSRCGRCSARPDRLEPPADRIVRMRHAARRPAGRPSPAWPRRPLRGRPRRAARPSSSKSASRPRRRASRPARASSPRATTARRWERASSSWAAWKRRRVGSPRRATRSRARSPPWPTAASRPSTWRWRCSSWARRRRRSRS